MWFSVRIGVVALMLLVGSAEIARAAEAGQPTRKLLAANSCTDDRILRKIRLDNQERSGQDLVCDEGLTKASAEWSRQQCSRGDISHDGFSGRCNRAKVSGGCAENVAYNFSPLPGSVDEVHKQWMNSPGHAKNIRNGNYGVAGYGYYECSDGRVYWTGMYAGDGSQKAAPRSVVTNPQRASPAPAPAPPNKVQRSIVNPPPTPPPPRAPAPARKSSGRPIGGLPPPSAAPRRRTNPLPSPSRRKGPKSSPSRQNQGPRTRVTTSKKTVVRGNTRRFVRLFRQGVWVNRGWKGFPGVKRARFVEV